MDLKRYIRIIPDFPKPGVQFRDITSLLSEPEAFRYTIDTFYERYKERDVDVVVGIESRGFIFAATLAYMLGCTFVPVRKEGKLPHVTLKQEYALEYGNNAVEIHEDAIKKGQSVVLVDDLIATGGTLLATIKLIELLGGDVLECAVVIELSDLKGRDELDRYPLFSMIDFRES